MCTTSIFLNAILQVYNVHLMLMFCQWHFAEIHCCLLFLLRSHCCGILDMFAGLGGFQPVDSGAKIICLPLCCSDLDCPLQGHHSLPGNITLRNVAWKIHTCESVFSLFVFLWLGNECDIQAWCSLCFMKRSGAMHCYNRCSQL